MNKRALALGPAAEDGGLRRFSERRSAVQPAVRHPYGPYGALRCNLNCCGATLECSASASDGIRSTKQKTAFVLNVGSDCARIAADERCCLARTRARVRKRVVHPEAVEWLSLKSGGLRVRMGRRGIGAIASGIGPRVSGNGASGKAPKWEWDDWMG